MAWVVDKYMGDGADKSAVLDYRASAHTLDDAPGSRKKPFIRNANDHIFGNICIIIAYILYFDIEILRLGAGHS